jgi:hypothetical protein
MKHGVRAVLCGEFKKPIKSALSAQKQDLLLRSRLFSTEIKFFMGVFYFFYNLRQFFLALHPAL